MYQSLLGSEENFNWLEKKAREWAQSVVELYYTPVPPQLQADKNALLERARKIKTTVEKVTGPLDALRPLDPIIQELGFLPLIVGAVGVSAAAAAITAWYTSYKKFKEKAALLKDLQAKGVAPDQAARIINTTFGEQSFLNSLSKTLVPLALISALIYMVN